MEGKYRRGRPVRLALAALWLGVSLDVLTTRIGVARERWGFEANPAGRWVLRRIGFLGYWLLFSGLCTAAWLGAEHEIVQRHARTTVALFSVLAVVRWTVAAGNLLYLTRRP
jgi:hypothetical protein